MLKTNNQVIKIVFIITCKFNLHVELLINHRFCLLPTKLLEFNSFHLAESTP